MASDAPDQQLADLFAEADTNIITYQDRTVRMGYDVPLRVDDHRATVRILRYKPSPIQGIRFRLKGGKLGIAGDLAEDMVIWTDTAPEQFDIELTWRRRVPPTLRIYNCWRGRHGEIQAWLANSGLVVDETPDGRYTFRCSDGPGGVDFEALVFDVQIGAAVTA